MSYLTTSILNKTTRADTSITKTFTTKSGINIDLGLIEEFVQLANESNLMHMIFEYDASSNSLFSFYHTINLPDISTSSKITLSPNVKRYTPPFVEMEFTTPDDSNIFMSTLENGDTFLFVAENNYSLTGGFGDALDLHPINQPRHNIFINHYIQNLLSNGDTRTMPSSKVKSCKRTYEYSVHVVSDRFLCRRFGRDDILTFYMIEQFFFQNMKMFMDLACIDIHLIGITSYCQETNYFNFRQKQCHNSDPSEAKCRTPLTKHIMYEMKNYAPYTSNAQRESVLFIYGLNISGTLAGLAYKSRACDSRHSNIWMNGLSRAAFYHEIGHLFGANHARDGIMQPNVLILDGIRFSDKSHNEISHFVEKDSRSWCLRRKYSSKQSDLLGDGWVKKNFLLPGSTKIPNLEFESISLAFLSSDRNQDLIFVIANTNTYPQETGRIVTLLYGTVKNVWRSPRLQGEEEIEYREVGLNFSSAHSHLSLRCFTSNRDESKGVVLSYFVTDSNERRIPHYRVGLLNSNGDIEIDSWGKEKVVEHVDLFDPDHYGVEIEMNTGHVGNEQSVDLLYMQLTREPDTQLIDTHYNTLENPLKYKIGFNMSTTGIVQSGWSGFITIPGESNTAWSISGSIMDVDENGKSDLVIYVVEYGPLFSPGGYTYFRVGKDLNSGGIVTGGWTDHKMTPSADNRYSMEKSMDVGKDLESGYSVLISAQRLQNNSRYSELEFSFSHKDLFKKVIKTKKKYSGIESVTEKCLICYDGVLIEKCQHKLSLCNSKIDELRILQDLPGGNTLASRRMELDDRNFGQSDTDANEFKNIPADDYFANETTRNNLKRNSIYCAGFQSFLSQKGV